VGVEVAAVPELEVADPGVGVAAPAIWQASNIKVVNTRMAMNFFVWFIFASGYAGAL
jgi:hypothetical protein